MPYIDWLSVLVSLVIIFLIVAIFQPWFFEMVLSLLKRMYK